MAPAAEPSPLFQLAATDHFFLIRPPLRTYVRRFRDANMVEVPSTYATLHTAVAQHCGLFPEDQEAHPGFRKLLATHSARFAMSKKRGSLPSWFLAEPDLIVRRSSLPLFLAYFFSAVTSRNFLMRVSSLRRSLLTILRLPRRLRLLHHLRIFPVYN